jgi:hypothetical protein
MRPAPELCCVSRRSLPRVPSRCLDLQVRHDEDTLDICGEAAYRTGSGDPWDEPNPGHADDL